MSRPHLPLSNFIIVLTTVPDETSGQVIAEKLLQDRKAACVTVLQPGTSFFWWEGKISREKEHLVLIKSRRELYPSIQKTIIRHHPYQVPEIISFSVGEAWEPYLSWINKETRS